MMVLGAATPPKNDDTTTSYATAPSEVEYDEEEEEQEDEEENESVNSHEEALCDMLGLPSLACVGEDEDKDSAPFVVSCRDFDSTWYHNTADHEMAKAVIGFKEHYESFGYCQFDASLSIPAAHLRRLTEQLVWSKETAVLRTFETITTTKHSTTTTATASTSCSCLTRLEHFCHQTDWRLVADHVRRCLSLALQEPMVLYKEKLNLKPPGGSGFAPHLDAPSLLQLQGTSNNNNSGPTEFVTVMVAIDAMTSTNGCLRIVPGPWTKENAVETVAAGNQSNNTRNNRSSKMTSTSSANSDSDLDDDDDRNNPDGGGRRGLIPSHIAETLEFGDLPLARGGDMVAFSGYLPHRSSSNASHFARRAVFLTYNPARQGDQRNAYYEQMRELRDHWRYCKKHKSRSSSTSEGEEDGDDADVRAMELQALKSIPRI